MEDTVFKQASSTFYPSSQLFPKDTRKDVFKLYSFVRIADDFVDSVPANKEAFLGLKKSWEGLSESSDPKIVLVVENIRYLTSKYGIKVEWVDSFLEVMQQDLKLTQYKTLEDSLEYVYGSGEVVGLMMAKLLKLPDEATAAARLQGRAMQWINFIRDIDEDNQLGRHYFPQEDLKKFGLDNLTRESAEANPENFKKFIHFQIERYKHWQTEAEVGYKYIPKRLLTPIKTAADMYILTAREIEKNPFIVFEKKLSLLNPKLV